jgi:hypothetical protein
VDRQVDLLGEVARVLGKGRKERLCPIGRPAATALRAALDARAAAPGGLGALSYEWFETMQFDVNTAVVSGRAVMTRDGKTHRGLFTRILRRTVDGWLIVHDQLAWRPEA